MREKQKREQDIAQFVTQMVGPPLFISIPQAIHGGPGLRKRTQCLLLIEP